MPSSNGITRRCGTRKFLNDHDGSVLTIRPPTAMSTSAAKAGWRMAAAVALHPHSWKASEAKSGKSASPAPAGAGTPVKKLCA